MEAMLDQRQTEARPLGQAEYRPRPDAARTLQCTVCGRAVTLEDWQPLIRCPHCAALVYPDRSMRNLLPMGWSCPSCGAANEGLTNFCLSCGAGLASRCLSCEAPISGPVCLRCGEHQAHLRALQAKAARRTAWIPIQRERIRTQQQRLAELERDRLEAMPAPQPGAEPSSRADRRAGRSRRYGRRRGAASRLGWGWIWIAIGALILISRAGSAMRDGQGLAISQPVWVGDAWAGLQTWWAAFVPSLGHLQTLTPQDPAYVYVFASLVVGLAALPLLLYLVARLARRVFP